MIVLLLFGHDWLMHLFINYRASLFDRGLLDNNYTEGIWSL